MPRLSERGEHYDNHQSEITEAFVARGLIWSAATTEELKAALTAARAATPRMATTDPADLIAYMNGLLAAACGAEIDRKSVVLGKSGAVRVDLGGRRVIKKKKKNKH